MEKAMVPYYGRYKCKQYMETKSVEFGYKLWVERTPLGYVIQFYPYPGKDANHDKELSLGGPVFISLVS